MAVAEGAEEDVLGIRARATWGRVELLIVRPVRALHEGVIFRMAQAEVGAQQAQGIKDLALERGKLPIPFALPGLAFLSLALSGSGRPLVPRSPSTVQNGVHAFPAWLA